MRREFTCIVCGTKKMTYHQNSKYCCKICYGMSTRSRIPRRLRSVFANIKSKCYNGNSGCYFKYGALGIRICDEWFNNPNLFYKWALMSGYTENKTVERFNQLKDFSPDNCYFKLKRMAK